MLTIQSSESKSRDVRNLREKVFFFPGRNQTRITVKVSHFPFILTSRTVFHFYLCKSLNIFDFELSVSPPSLRMIERNQGEGDRPEEKISSRTWCNCRTRFLFELCAKEKKEENCARCESTASVVLVEWNAAISVRRPAKPAADCEPVW